MVLGAFVLLYATGGIATLLMLAATEMGKAGVAKPTKDDFAIWVSFALFWPVFIWIIAIASTLKAKQQ